MPSLINSFQTTPPNAASPVFLTSFNHATDEVTMGFVTQDGGQQLYVGQAIEALLDQPHPPTGNVVTVITCPNGLNVEMLLSSDGTGGRTIKIGANDPISEELAREVAAAYVSGVPNIDTP